MISNCLKLLPSARLVSSKIIRNSRQELSGRTQFLTQWGQFLAHDLALTPLATSNRTPYKSDVSCGCESCAGIGGNWREFCAARLTKGKCFPIAIPEKDYFFRQRSCLEFTRSAAGQLTFGPREQRNELTSFIDASNVYGSSEKVGQLLREKRHGLMKTSERFLLPIDRSSNEVCQRKQGCFLAGDVRNSITAPLASMHTVWLHTHNNIVRGLAKLGVQGDELLYQIGRQIVGRVHQHITYKYFLPSFLGPEIMVKYDLSVKNSGFFTGHSKTCDATILNEFAVAALRVGHSIFHNVFPIGSDFWGGHYNIQGKFFNPDFLHKSKEDNFLKLSVGLFDQHCQKADGFFDQVLINHLFGSVNMPDGTDLFALNIQRGRDHGIQPYLKYRQHYGLYVPRRFSDLDHIMGQKARKTLEQHYCQIWDIDLYVGLILEKEMTGGMVGELAANIIGDQFSRLKRCDSFYYENEALYTGQDANPIFHRRNLRKQLDEIRKVSFKSILCPLVNGKDFAFGLECPEKTQVPKQSPDADAPINLAPWKIKATVGGFSEK